MRTSSKQDLGQFYTTKAQYIIENLLSFIPKNIVVVDPFAGNFDLINLISDEFKFEAFDIDPQNEITIRKNTLLDIPNYNGKYVLTNPPYLARNKTKNPLNKTLFDKYKLNDLYKIAIKTIMDCRGGILIVPLNFFSEEHSIIRNEFCSKFRILQLNIFEEQVFEDTSYTVCSFAFENASEQLVEQNIPTVFFPNKENCSFTINQLTNFRLAGDFYSKIHINSNVKVNRLIAGDQPSSNLKLRAIDTGSCNGRINLSFYNEYYFDTTPNKTDRTFATIKLSVNLNENQQKFIANKFNEFLEENRKQYHSLFLTNFRNSTKHYARKRISFETAYQIIRYLIETNKKELKFC